MRASILLLLAGSALAGCASGPPKGGTPYQPTAAMTEVLAERMAMHAKAPERISVAEARDVPSLVDAAQAIRNVAGLPAPIIEVKQFNFITGNGAAGPVGALLYRPALAKDTPIIIFYPGGTWVTRSDVAVDEIARQLATRTGWIVLTVQPRLAPEARFPAVHEDAMAAYRWARAHLREWGADPTKVVLAGEGPGANLALSTALEARDLDRSAATVVTVPLPDHLLLITPWAGTSTSTASMAENASSRPLSRSTISWAQRAYASGDLGDKRIDLASREDFRGLPPTTFVLADIDPLRSGAEQVAEAMRRSGVRSDVRLYRGVTYEFFGLGASVPEAATAEQDAVNAMRVALAQPDIHTPPLAPPGPVMPLSRSNARR